MKCRNFLSFLVLLSIVKSSLSISESNSTESTGSVSESEDAAVENFRKYLRINTAHPHPDFESAIEWIIEQAISLNLTYHIVRFPSTTSEFGFTIWLTWPGINPSLESIFLYSHIDVVPINSGWTRDPFGAEMDDFGNIYARGSQDMKSVGVQYLEAIRNLMDQGFTPNRTIHIGFFSDEETGGKNGIKLFIHTPEFKNLNIGLLLDEGMPNENFDEMSVYYAQRTLVWAKFTALGNTGHGSLLLDDTAAEKIRRVINKLLDMRQIEKSRLEENDTLRIGDVTSINLNVLEGGIAANVNPPKLSATFDMRFTPNWTNSEVMTLLNETCLEAGPNVTFEFVHTTLTENSSNAVTNLDEDSWWWQNFQEALLSMNITPVPRVFPAGTDGEVTRRLGIPTLGFSPIYNTTMLFHDRDEYLNVEVFLKGIEIYETLIQTLSYVEPPPPPPVTTTEAPEIDEEDTSTPTPDKAEDEIMTTSPPKKKHTKGSAGKLRGKDAYFWTLLLVLLLQF